MSNKTLNSIMFPGLENVYRIIAQAEEFLSTSTYDVGDYVTHEGYLYNCISPITSAGSWNSSKWTQVNLSSIVENLQESLGDIYDPTSTYELDDRVTYQGILYKCTSAIPVAEAWNSSHWTILTVGEELKLLQDIKANIDGSYDSMTVGNAEQLIATQYIEDKIPYSFRHSGGSNDIGDREQDTLVGGTLAWNQLVKNGNFVTTANWSKSRCTFEVSDGIAIATSTTNTNGSFLLYQPISIPYTHKCLVIISIMCETTNPPKRIAAGASSTYWNGHVGRAVIDNPTQNVWYDIAYLAEGKQNTNGIIQAVILQNDASLTTIGDKLYVKNAMMFDLTQMFGSAIADYIYGLEAANEGAGVAWFRKLFPAPYYAYQPGTLESSRANAHKMVGFNQWDEEWELGTLNSTTGAKVSGTNNIRSANYIPVVPGTTYHFHNGGAAAGFRVCEYDANYAFVNYTSSGAERTMTASTAYIRFYMAGTYGTIYNHDICINLSWSGTRNGEYEPYAEHTYPLDDTLTLRGIPKLDTDNNLYYDGDIYEADGTVTRRYGIVDLGTLTWDYNSAYAFFESAQIADGKRGSEIVCDKYTYGGINTTQSAMASAQDKSVYSRITAGAQTIVYVKDTAYSDAASFKTAMSGVYLVYELAAPTTESAEPFAAFQIVNDFGTEEYIDAEYEAGNRDFIFPQGHDTKYPANLRDKLQHLPDLASTDGDYIIRQTDNNMSLVHYPFAYENNPEMDGVASAGTSLLWSRGDHRHPTDTTIYKSFPVNTISNTEVASFADGANSIPVQEFIMDITSVQDGTPAPNGPNIYDASTNTEGYYIADDGSIVVGANSFYSGYYAVNANQRYNLSATITFTSLNRVRIHGYDASKNWVNELYTGAVEAGTQTFQAVMIIPANVSFVRFSFNKNNTNTVFCEYNERPISGYTSAFIRGTGKNLFNSDGLLNASGWVKNSDGSYSGANDQLSRSRFDVVENCFPGLLTNRLGVDFTFSGTVTASSSLYIIFDIINAETGAIRQVARINITDTSFVLSTNCAENEYVSSMWFSYGTHHDITLSNIQLEFGRTATAYSAYVGRAYTVSWQSEAGTVYGGTLTWINGDTWTLTINKMLKLVESSDSNTFNNGVATVPNFFDGLSISNPICSHFVYEAGTSSDNTFYGVSTNRNLQIRSSAFSSKAEFNSFLESNTVQILTGFPSSVTPPSYTLTATDSEISTLFGINNLCTNCGNINTLTYHADPTLYANGIITPFKASIAPTEDGDVASQSYSQGEYFFRGTSFCKALTSIASGASFTLNTNYITTTVAAELFAAQNT